MAELKSHSAKFFEVLLTVDETVEDGTKKVRKRTIVVDAQTFGEAEEKAIEESMDYCHSELCVLNISPATYAEVFTSDSEDDDKFYRAKLEFITADEKTGKEKRSRVNYLVQARSLNRALRYVDDVMKGSMLDYDSVGVVGTKIEDVYFHSPSETDMQEENE